MKIDFINITKRYGSQTALDELSLKLKDKSFTALIGNNGCGKTTAINILCNIIDSNSGQVLLDGSAIKPDENAYKGNMGIVLSTPYYVENFTVKEYLRFVCKFQKMPKREIDRRIHDILTLLEIEKSRKIIRKLSSGNQMKVSMAAALIHNPELLVLDEPFINLDIATTQRLITLLIGFKGKKTLLITSHDLDTVANLCDEFLIMDQGKIMLRLHKDDFASIEALKEEIKLKLTKREDVQNLAWLS